MALRWPGEIRSALLFRSNDIASLTCPNSAPTDGDVEIAVQTNVALVREHLSVSVAS
jgi:hypothetical protein